MDRMAFIFGIIAILYWRIRFASCQTCSSNIRSPNYPNIYPENLNCTWIRYASEGSYVLKFDIDNLDLEQCSRCTCDYLEVFDGSSTASKSLGKYCTGKVNLLSTGKALTIVFHTDHSRSHASNTGFSASYSSVSRSSVCFSNSDTIRTYYASYGNVECSWTLSANSGYIVVFEVTSLSFGTCSDTCGCGQLEVYDGGSESSPKLGSWCVLPSQLFISEGNSLHIRLVASSLSKTHEFQATYKYVAEIGVCESSTSLVATESEKEVKSYDHPSKYIRHVDCTWKITAGDGQLVRFTVTELDFGDCVSCGFVQIYDGQTESIGRNIGKWTSGKPDIISSGKYMVVKFTTTSFETTKGITAEYQAIPKENVCTKIAGDQGVIQSYEYPHSYPGNINCFWVMKSPPNYLIRFYTGEIRFPTNCTVYCDYLEVYDGSTTLDSKLGTYKDNKISLISSSTQLSIRFKTFTGGSGGFSGNYLFIKESEVCKDSLNLQASRSDVSGQTISSRDFPVKYWGNMRCFWRIQADRGYKIRLIVQTIEFEKCDSCGCDYIHIFDGPDKYSTSLKKWCSIPPDLISSGNQLSIEMRTDGKNQYRGFKAKYFAIHKDQVCPGSGLITEELGTIKSPNYPEHYYGGIRCDWTITVPVRKRIRIKSKSLNLEKCAFCKTCDYLEITDNSVPADNSVIGTWCKTSFDVISRGNSVNITFKSNVNNVGENFIIEYETINEDEVCPMQVVSDSSGKLTSLGYPDMTYPGNLNCSYHIKTPNDNQVVRLEFVEFHLAACGFFESCSTCGDAVQAIDYDGEDLEFKRFHPWCSSDAPPTHIFSSGGNLLVNFYTDMQSQDVGFRAQYRSVDKNLGCLDTGVLTKTSGGFKGPNAPFDSETLCTWLIKVPEKHYIVLTFGYSSIPDKDCTFAYVEAYDGDSPTSKSFGRFCEHYWQKEIESTGSSMYVTLWVDATLKSNGVPSFSATYEAIEIVDVGNHAAKSAKFENKLFGFLVFATSIALWDLV